MNTFELVISGLAALALFAYGLQSLSRQIEETGGERLKRPLSRVTESPVKAISSESLALGFAAMRPIERIISRVGSSDVV